MTIKEIEDLVVTLRRLGVRHCKTADVELDLTDTVPLTHEQQKAQAVELKKALELSDYSEDDIRFWSTTCRPYPPKVSGGDPD